MSGSIDRHSVPNEDEVRVVVEIARAASQIVTEVYARPFVVDYKSPGDPVTEADRRANELVVERLAAAFPGVPVVAEESAPESFGDYRTAERVFFVDPLDGTREFVRQSGEFVVMIGMLVGDRPALGVIVSPTLDTAWVGVVGVGAWAEEAGGGRTPIEVSSTSELAAAAVVVSRSQRQRVRDDLRARLGVASVERLGSSGLKAVDVARGAADLYVAPYTAGKRWDACAAEALVVAAGGRLTEVSGALIDYRAVSLDNDGGIVASNGELHEAVLKALVERS